MYLYFLFKIKFSDSIEGKYIAINHFFFQFTLNLCINIGKLHDLKKRKNEYCVKQTTKHKDITFN